MIIGPGKYEDLAAHARAATRASGSMVVIIGGAQGNGFACDCDALMLQGLPRALRYLANEIERTAAAAVDQLFDGGPAAVPVLAPAVVASPEKREGLRAGLAGLKKGARPQGRASSRT